MRRAVHSHWSFFTKGPCVLKWGFDWHWMDEIMIIMNYNREDAIDKQLDAYVTFGQLLPCWHPDGGPTSDIRLWLWDRPNAKS